MQYYSEEMPDDTPKWICLDGDLDANWIESMNSVMDDNKLLTLANNGRILLKNYMRLLFEIRDLIFATPATVSRAGILYISDDDGYQRVCYFKSWTNKFINDPEVKSKLLDPSELGEHLERMMLFYNEQIIKVMKNYKYVTIVNYFSMIVSLCKML
jgi:dynein heavy chain, axonemal